MRIPIISFFTGAGFLDMGFEDAGFDIVWTNELNPAFADMYEYAITEWRRSKDDKAEAAVVSSRESVTDLVAEDIIAEAFGETRPKLFGMIGGPPCPDFSIRGKNKGANGENGRLSRTFADLITEIKPSFFVMENVPGLYRTKKHRWFLSHLRSQIEKCGYLTDLRILNALELGAPQDRERLFMIGILKKLVKFGIERETQFEKGAWFDWPEIKHEDVKTLPWPKTNPFKGKAVRPPRIPIELTVHPILFSDPKPSDIPNGDEAFNPYSQRFWQIDEGDVSGNSFKRLHRYRYSPTACYGNNEVHLHPTEPRRLSVRETLRIQTVPDAYVLPSDYGLTPKFKMISNGVPYIMAKELAVSVFNFVKSLKLYEEVQTELYLPDYLMLGDNGRCLREQRVMLVK